MSEQKTHFQQMYDWYKEHPQFEHDVRRKGYFFPIVENETEIYIVFPITSKPELNHNIEAIGGGIDSHETLEAGLRREIWEELVFPKFVKRQEGQNLIDLDFLNNPNTYFYTFNKQVESAYYHGNNTVLELIEAASLLKMETIKQIIETQVEAMDEIDRNPTQKVISNSFLEKQGCVLIPMNEFLKLVIRVTKDKTVSRSHVYIRAERPHVVPKDEKRTEYNDEFIEGLKKFLGENFNDETLKKEDWYRFSRFFVASLAGKGRFYINFLEKVGLCDWVDQDILRDLENCSPTMEELCNKMRE